MEMEKKVEEWLDAMIAAAVAGSQKNQGYWDLRDEYEYLPWEGVRVSGEDQYGRKQYEDVSGMGFFKKTDRKRSVKKAS